MFFQMIWSSTILFTFIQSTTNTLLMKKASNALMKLRVFLLLTFILTNLSSKSNPKVTNCFSPSKTYFTKNCGQWPNNVLFRASIKNVTVWFEKNCITYQITNPNISIHEKPNAADSIYSQVYKVMFNNPNQESEIIYSKPLQHYNNYFLGNDTSKWRGKVPNYNSFTYKNLYDGIDMNFVGAQDGFEYSFIVNDKKNIDKIKFNYKGIDKLKILENGNLNISTFFGIISESKPTITDMKGGKLNCNASYLVNDNILQFEIDKNITTPFIIDPTIVFSTFSGSLSDNFGLCATPDNNGLLINAGLLLGNYYPTTPGVFTSNSTLIIGSDNTDIGITKFDATGSNLIYSTYIGGSSSDVAESIITNKLGELYIMGTTSSTDFPNLSNGYQNINKRGTTQIIGGIDYDFGTDLFIIKLRSDCSALTAATYYGGEGNDGIGANNLLYIDALKGEIRLDTITNEVFVSSHTSSTQLNGLQTPYNITNLSEYKSLVLKFNANLNNLLWAGVLSTPGYSNFGYSIDIKNNNEIYVAGFTNGGNIGNLNLLSETTNSNVDHGYIWKINCLNSNLSKIKYIASEYDNVSYFVKYKNNYVYVTGYTNGGITEIFSSTNFITNKNYILKTDENLTQVIFLTLKGGVRKNNQLAFQVDDCNRIYYCAIVAKSSTTLAGYLGAETTSNAFKPFSPNGEDLYVAVFAPNCSSILFGTYYGNDLYREHIDGGHSRFDDHGNLYVALCEGCGGNSLFPTTSNAYATTNASTNCNAASIKFELENLPFQNSFTYTRDCNSLLVNFLSTSSDDNITWNFGDGNIGTGIATMHNFNDFGTYVVSMSNDSNSCTLASTKNETIQIYQDTSWFEFSISQTDCIGYINLDITSSAMTPDIFFLLDFGDGTIVTTNENIANHSYNTNTNTLPDSIFITMMNENCYIKKSKKINFIFNSTIDTSLTICSFQNPIYLDGFDGANSYNWSNKNLLSNGYIQKPQLILNNPFNGTITCNEIITLQQGVNCQRTVNYKITSSNIASLPISINVEQTNINIGDTVYLSATEIFGIKYEWQPSSIINNNIFPNTIAFPEADTTITLVITEPKSNCIILKSFKITVQETACNASSIDVANCLTANNDGINDVIFPHTIVSDNFNFSIYNRWGQNIFNSNNINEGWDATFKGTPVDDGVYGYIINSRCLNGKTITKKGNITVIR